MNPWEMAEFGSGDFTNALHDNVADLIITEQARYSGWVSGCPVVLELTDPANTASGRGPEAMAARYLDINIAFNYISERLALDGRIKLTPMQRPEHEPVGKHEPKSVPETYYYEMAPMNTPWGYGLPRVLIEQLGPKDQPLEIAQTRMQKGLDILDVAIALSSSPAELLATFGEGIAQLGVVKPEVILRHVLSAGKLAEENCKSLYIEVINSLMAVAPTLWDTYKVMTPNDRKDLGIIEKTDLRRSFEDIALSSEQL